MKTKEEQIIKVLKIIFGVMFLSVIVLFFLGEIFIPDEDPTGSGECVLFESDWRRIFSDGTSESIDIPGQCNAKRGEVVRLETTLPKNQGNT